MAEDVTRAVAGADLDLVELALTVPGLRLEGAPRVLTDPERTPIADLHADGTVAALRPLADRPELRVDGVLPLTDPAIRAAAAGVAFDALPTRAQIAAVDRLVDNGPIAWLALAGRSRGAAAGRLLRAVQAAAAAWSARTGREAPVAAVPWNLDAAPAVLASASLRTADGLAVLLSDALGIDEVVVLGEGDEHRALAHLEADAAGAARALFPAEVLEFHRDERRGGCVVLFTGLSGSGKSTIAKALAARLADAGSVSLLDGDEVRQLLSAGLGFDAESRALNIRRIGWVAAEIARAGGTAIAAPIAPFAAGRAEVQAMAEAAGASFLLVHVSTPLEVAEARDRKGLYAAARAGRVAEFTGISSPYEPPEDADVVVDAAVVPVEEAVERVLAALHDPDRRSTT